MTTGSEPPEKPVFTGIDWSNPLVATAIARAFVPLAAGSKTASTPKRRKLRTRRRRRRAVDRVETRLLRAVPRTDAQRMFVALLREQVIGDARLTAATIRRDLRELLRAYGAEIKKPAADITRLSSTRLRIRSLERRLGVAQQTLAALAVEAASRRPGRPGRSGTLRRLVLHLAAKSQRDLSDRSRARMLQQQLQELTGWLMERTGVRWKWPATLENIRSVLRSGTK